MLNAIRYWARSGVGRRMLPINFGPWQTVYWWFRRFVRRLLFQTIHDVALMLDWEQSGRAASPAVVCWTAKQSRRRPQQFEAKTTTNRSAGASGTSPSTQMAGY